MNRQLYPACLAMLTWLSACSNQTDSDPGHAQYVAEIRRTSFGIPHIKAPDEGGLGFGVGYAYAQDNVCLMAAQLVTVNGERSRYFGPDAKGQNAELSNLQTDFFYALINDAQAVDAAWQAQPEPMKALINGYVAGYNLYLDKHAAGKLPAACREAAWVRKVSASDIVKLIRSYAVESGSAQFIGAIVGAAPPGVAPAAAATGALKALQPEYWRKQRERTGSNGVALGKSATENGAGMVLANPHFPWQGHLRFYQLHLTIPGKLDVMGASLGGLPQVNIGFNQHVAWTHTVNTSNHFSLHALQLDPADPTRFMLDGQSHSMQRKSITVQVKDADGVVRPRSHQFYASPHGYLVSSPDALAWTARNAFVLHDPNLVNHRMLEQWHAMGRARNVEELQGAVDRVLGLPWVNTLAADMHGNTLYMNVSVVPNVSSAKAAACIPGPFRESAGYGFMVLDASTSTCALGNDSSAPQQGIFGSASLPRLSRNDYVQNSNDSSWLTNPAAPLTGFPAIVSIDGMQQQGRTRLGISQLEAHLGGIDGKARKLMSVVQLQELALSNRVYLAGLAHNDVVRACSSDVALAGACAIMAAWDGSAGVDANLGFAYFNGVWNRVGRMPGLWTVPFDPRDPIGTPRGFNVANPEVASAVRQALGGISQYAASLGLPANARWGDVQGVMRQGLWIPIPGGDGELGIYNAIESAPADDGRLHVMFGTSFVQTVTFDASGPRAHALLSYSQSTDPASPHHADQTARFSDKSWIEQAFTEAQIRADPVYHSISIFAPRRAER